MEEKEKRLYELIKFRSLMNSSVSKEDVKRIWGKEFVRNLDRKVELKEYSSDEVDRKIKLARDNIKYLKVFNLVKFIGISGSVASGFAKEEDDIDVFVVVKDYTAWLYRGIVSFQNIFHNRIRTKRHKNVKDKYCLNIIREERGLLFEEDIFNFHELMYLVPIFNERYLNNIFASNRWLRDKYSVKKELLIYPELTRRKKNIFLLIFNYLLFTFQLFFMFLSGHNPNVKRIISNYNNGIIEFFDDDFKKKKMSKYLKSI